FRTRKSPKPPSSKRFSARSRSMAVCRSPFPASPIAAPASTVTPNPHLEVPSMPSHNHVMKSACCALLAALFFLPACSINVKDKKDGNDAKVDINTPVGDLDVNEGADIRDTGLALYPGAKPAPKESGDDKKSANVNLSFGGFGLRVVAAEFVSD